MSEQLGKIEKPSADEYKKDRKIYFVPLIFVPMQPKPELMDIVNRYWDQVEFQVTNLENKLNKANKIYHELIPIGGEKGINAIEELNKGSHKIAKSRLENSAVLYPVESANILTEFMDWSKCLSIGLENPNVFDKVWGFYTDAQKRRNEYIVKQIDESLKPGEAGLLLMREGHAVQFPTDIQVFYVAPPALDEMKRWFREREAEIQNQKDDKQQQEEKNGGHN